MQKNKRILILAIIIVAVGVIFAGMYLKKDSGGQPTTQPMTIDEESTVKNPEMKHEPMTEVELASTVKSKRYIENAYMALEYSKVSNMKLIEALEAYVEDPTRMKEEEVLALITSYEKSFLNRYLKVYITSPDVDLTDLNYELRRTFFGMKVGFDELKLYGNIPQENSLVVNGEGQLEVPEEPTKEGDESAQVDENFVENNKQEQTEKPKTEYDINGIPINKEEKEKKEPVYDIEIIKNGLEKLKKAQTFVNAALKEAGLVDIEIEKKWISAGIQENDVLEMMDKTNAVDSTYSEKEVGEYTPPTREESLSDEDSEDE